MPDYNGWTNYETWRVNLEFLDGIDPTELWDDNADDIDSLTDSLAGVLESITEEAVYQDIRDDSFAASLVADFLRQVNWREIAEHFVENYREDWPEQVTESTAARQ
jgi:hypothetical protein